MEEGRNPRSVFEAHPLGKHIREKPAKTWIHNTRSREKTNYYNWETVKEKLRKIWRRGYMGDNSINA